MDKGKIKWLGKAAEGWNMPLSRFIYLFIFNREMHLVETQCCSKNLPHSCQSWAGAEKGSGSGNTTGLLWAAPQWWPFQILNMLELTTWREETCVQTYHMVYILLSWSIETFPRNPVARSSVVRVLSAQAWLSRTVSDCLLQRCGIASAVSDSTLASAVSTVMLLGHWCVPRAQDFLNRSFWTDLDFKKKGIQL